MRITDLEIVYSKVVLRRLKIKFLIRRDAIYKKRYLPVSDQNTKCLEITVVVGI